MAKVKITFSKLHMAPWPYYKHENHSVKWHQQLSFANFLKSCFHFLKHDIHILQNDFQIDVITPYPFDKHDFHF